MKLAFLLKASALAPPLSVMTKKKKRLGWEQARYHWKRSRLACVANPGTSPNRTPKPTGGGNRERKAARGARGGTAPCPTGRPPGPGQGAGGTAAPRTALAAAAGPGAQPCQLRGGSRACPSPPPSPAGAARGPLLPAPLLALSPATGTYGPAAAERSPSRRPGRPGFPSPALPGPGSAGERSRSARMEAAPLGI